MTTTQKARSSLLLPSLSPSHCLLTSPSKTSATPPIHHWDTLEASFLSSFCPYIYIYIHTYVLVYHAPPTSVEHIPVVLGGTGEWRLGIFLAITARGTARLPLLWVTSPPQWGTSLKEVFQCNEVNRVICPKNHPTLQSKTKSLVDRCAETGLGKVSLNIEKYYCMSSQKKYPWLI